MNFTQYKRAIVCRDLPNSLDQGLSTDPHHDKVNLGKAVIKHKEYLDTLEQLGLKLISIEVDEAYPDCVFVEDIAIAIGNKILITNPGAPSRQGETKQMIERVLTLKKTFNIHQIDIETDAHVDGGDVCYTGREILVGLSKRTNSKGVEALGKFFNDMQVTSIEVKNGLHLKSVISMCGLDAIVMGTSSTASDIKNQIISKSKFAHLYKFVSIPSDDLSCANVLFINETLIYPAKYSLLYENHVEFKNVKKISIDNDEFSKIDGALTCRSVLLNL